jgi:hypothetical protein
VVKSWSNDLERCRGSWKVAPSARQPKTVVTGENVYLVYNMVLHLVGSGSSSVGNVEKIWHTGNWCPKKNQKTQRPG